MNPRISDARIQKYFNLAKQACQYSHMKRARVGSAFVYKNKVLSVGWNSNKTAPIQAYWNKERFNETEVFCSHSLHAETTALLGIKHLDINWSKVIVFNWRLKRNGSQGNSRPCKSCMAMLISQGIENIFYSTEDGWAYEQIRKGQKER